jgi:hypothetical protein
MHKVSRVSVCGAITVAVLGVGYDSGWFGPTDGHDHSAPVSITMASTSSVSAVNAVMNNVTGEDVSVAPAPRSLIVTLS